MVYGMTNRLPWSGRSPDGIWKVWDEFGMAGSEMMRVLDEGESGQAFKSRGTGDGLSEDGKGADRRGQLGQGAGLCRPPVIDWKALGLNPAKVRIRAPEIPGIQFAASFAPGERIPFEPGKGWILIVE